jgi:hypothetical protein
MAIQLWGEYRPDVSDLKGNGTRRIENVVPRGDGYGPVADITAYTSALPAACRGGFRALASDGSIRIFAGTATGLFLMDNSDQSWSNVSKQAASHLDLSGALASAYIGDMNGGGGKDEAFDGSTNEASGINTCSATGPCYVGVTFATATAIKAATIYGGNDVGFISGSNPSVTINLYGKNGSAPADGLDGTIIGTVTFTDTADESAGRTITMSDTSTEWDHVWAYINGGALTTVCAELRLTSSFEYAVPDANKWEFAQYDDFVVAVQPGNVPQVYQIGTDTKFADLGGSPPTATHVAVVNEFLMLSGLTSNRGRVQWSARSDIEAWTAGIDESDFQDLPDGGDVGPIAGGEHSAILLQDYAMRRMTYQPGSPVIFSFDRISEDIGIIAPYSVVKAGQRIFFISNAGFQQSIDGNVPVPIGKERVDQTFISEWDGDAPQLTFGFPDPRGTRIFFAYKTEDGEAGLFNKILCYDWLLDRWSPITGISGEFVTALAQVGQTLEGLDDLEGATFTADTTNGDATLTNVNDFTDLYVGMTIVGTGIPANTTILSLTPGSNEIEMSQNASATNTTVTIIASGSIDSLETSLDAFAVAFGREVSVFNSSHVMGFMHGDNLEAILETAEQGEATKQTYIDGCHPITDAASVYGQVSAKQRIGDTRVWNTEAAMGSTGFLPGRLETRWYRFRNRIPAGEDWTFTAGVEPVARITGNR